MKIVEVKTYMIDVPPPHWDGRHWIFVKLVTDEGIEGVGFPRRHTQGTYQVGKRLYRSTNKTRSRN